MSLTDLDLQESSRINEEQASLHEDAMLIEEIASLAEHPAWERVELGVRQQIEAFTAGLTSPELSLEKTAELRGKIWALHWLLGLPHQARMAAENVKLRQAQLHAEAQTFLEKGAR